MCNQLGHFASQYPNTDRKKKGKDDESNTAAMAMTEFGRTFKEELALVSEVTSMGSCPNAFDQDWVLDGGATRHMTDTWSNFLSVTEKGPSVFVRQGETVLAVSRINTVRFKLVLDETLELEGFLFVLGLRKSLISISALDDAGCRVMFTEGHAYLFAMGNPADTILLGSQKGELYALEGHNVYPSSGWISEFGTEGEAAVAHIIQFPENSGSLESTGKRLSQYEGCEHDDVEEDADSYSASRMVYRS